MILGGGARHASAIRLVEEGVQTMDVQALLVKAVAGVECNKIAVARGATCIEPHSSMSSSCVTSQRAGWAQWRSMDSPRVVDVGLDGHVERGCRVVCVVDRVGALRWPW